MDWFNALRLNRVVRSRVFPPCEWKEGRKEGEASVDSVAVAVAVAVWNGFEHTHVQCTTYNNLQQPTTTYNNVLSAGETVTKAEKKKRLH